MAERGTILDCTSRGMLACAIVGLRLAGSRLTFFSVAATGASSLGLHVVDGKLSYTVSG